MADKGAGHPLKITLGEHAAAPGDEVDEIHAPRHRLAMRHLMVGEALCRAWPKVCP